MILPEASMKTTKKKVAKEIQQRGKNKEKWRKPEACNQD